MNPMVANIIMYERELEVQKLVRESALIRSEVQQAEEPWTVQESRWSFLVDLFRAGARRQQAVQNC
jgi:hypothetical protein